MNRSHGIFFKIVNLLISVSFPFFVLMFSVILLFRPWFLSYEYTLKNFPEDVFGFSQTDRQIYGLQSMNYITQNNPKPMIEEILDENNQPIYLKNEISHMRDVRSVFQMARLTWFILLLSYAFIFGLHWNHPRRFIDILHSFQMGVYFTLGISFALIILVFFAFDPLFDWFHSLFFADGSWLFYADNTLIRLFPQKLWIDAFAWAGALTLFFTLSFTLILSNAIKRMRIRS